jgi:hypothetical protein
VNGFIVTLNQRCLNFLTAMRTYLDHVETRLKRSYGDDSAQIQEFKRVTASEFDGHFAYRFVSKLRNYTQHCGMPLGRILANSALPTPTPTEKEQHCIDFYFTRDDLLRNFSSWGGIVKPELEKMPNDFPISGYLKQTAESLRRIDAVVTKIDQREVNQYMDFLAGMITELGPANGMPCVYKKLQLIPVSGGAKADLDFERFPIELMAQLSSV